MVSVSIFFLMRSLFIGRFQPFHLGHLEVIRDISKESENEELVIGIGSAQKSHTLKNPFTSGERVTMVKSSLLNQVKSTFYVIPLRDINRNSVWISHLKSMCPKFGAIYSNNPLVKQLTKESKKEIKSFPLYEREKYQGTEIRRRILENKKWKHLVPEETSNIIERIGGIDRLRNIRDEDV